jgi:hypothetical protein
MSSPVVDAGLGAGAALNRVGIAARAKITKYRFIGATSKVKSGWLYSTTVVAESLADCQE